MINRKREGIRLLAVFLAVIAWFAVAPASCVRAEAPEAFRDSALQREVFMPNGAGPFHYYAQNDPIWKQAIYEAPKASKPRPFGDGGCNPTSLAVVVASLVPAERLNLLGMNTAKDRTFRLCSCSVNKYYCYQRHKDENHAPSTLITGEDFAAVLPLAFADFATGNNAARQTFRLPGKREGGNGGTSQRLFAPIAEIYGLSYRDTRNLDDVLATLDNGGLAIALCSGVSQIFSSGNGHYVVICSYDEEYLYILDPFVRDTYEKDRRGVIEPVEEGVIKVKRTNIKRTGFGKYSLFEPAPAAFYAKLPLLTDPYAPAFAGSPLSDLDALYGSNLIPTSNRLG